MPSADRQRPPSDTIAAVATPPGRGGVGIVRVSGPLALRVAKALIGRQPAPRMAAYCDARDAGGEVIDRGLALWFPAPHSYTGEDVFEFQGHGGPAVTGEVLRACLAAGARPAEAGEFTRRAFLNDKLDLAQAEAVADLIDASSAEAARLAMRSLSGEFSAAIEALVRGLIELRALTEAMLDFPEEEVDALHADDARGRLARIRSQLDEVLRQSRQGSLLREGIRVVIAGRPNVGKSSLLNRLAGEERAIVTAIPGTTRDALREAIQIQGVPIHVVDTAGLRITEDAIEREGIARAWREVEAADLVLAVFEADCGIGPEDEAILRELPATARRLHVFNKVDLLATRKAQPASGEDAEIQISAKTGEGMDLLRQAIVEAAGWQTGSESMFLARARHLAAVAAAAGHLEAAAQVERRWELYAEELRLAQAALSSITGEFSADDLLGEIFSRFCIGK
ncbi:MAG: tRNA uridine-5-carboxymethylaminomethyl(34) synthesis GTPase MnmE [Betaproteobacteria bacterium]|nr:tRNA uridine-5-carboxymethylaminomethyl(34) synthesis GTPase MnmE [Betaproteobacteria bacterium]